MKSPTHKLPRFPKGGIGPGVHSEIREQPLKAPFPYFGGKRRVAQLVWSRLGNVDNFIEPFCGSTATLLARPHAPRVETINDADCMVANFWRATQQSPEEVARWADGPVNEADLHARHRWLVLSDEAREFRERMKSDPSYFDPKIAGWWCWGICCWIGGGWCTVHGETADGSYSSQCDEERRPVISLPGSQGGNGFHAVGPLSNRRPGLSGDVVVAGRGIHAGSKRNGKRPKLSGENPTSIGCGVHSGVPSLRQQAPTAEQCRTGGKGVHGAGPSLQQKRPRAHSEHGHGGKGGFLPGVHASGRPQLADAYDVGRGIHANGQLGTCDARREWLTDWFQRLRDRLRLVRVCCGDWTRVCDSESVTTRLGLTGIFFDPPYALNLERLHAWILHLSGKGPEPKKQRRGGNRDAELYASDAHGDVDRLVAAVHVYCLERGGDRRYRIALCGYAGEHDALTDLGWECVEWKAHGGYGNRGKAKGKKNANAERERIWFSPHCVKDERPRMAELFA